MTMQLSAGRRLAFAGVALIAALMLLFAYGPANASAAGGGDTAVAAKKKCKPKKGKGTVGKKPKKCKKKKSKGIPPAPPTPAPTPQPLTAAEVINQIGAKAAQYCAVDPDCVNFGYWSLDDPGAVPDCDIVTTFVWSCFGWNDEDLTPGGDPEETCTFREVVQRVGINGVASAQDLAFGGAGGDPAGWECEPFVP